MFEIVRTLQFHVGYNGQKEKTVTSVADHKYKEQFKFVILSK
jgi:hypothetical protein